MPENERESVKDRRGFLTTLSSLAMAAGLVSAYGALAAVASRFLMPSSSDVGWLFVSPTNRIKSSQALDFSLPDGSSLMITRRGQKGGAGDFLALSKVCPHLGCQVHWEPYKNRFFCPCHNGIFDPSGKAISGPPAQGNQRLTAYDLKVEGGLLYVGYSLTSLASATGTRSKERGRPGHEHDPCRQPQANTRKG